MKLFKSTAKRVQGQLGPTRNSEVLASFIAYCTAHPEERFWQALRNWCDVPFVLVSDIGPHDIEYIASTRFQNLYDTFYWEGIGT